MAKFAPGKSGNPAGMKPGTKHRHTQRRQQLEKDAPAVMRKLVVLAKQGDPTALRIFMDRTMPPIREEPLAVKLPPITSTADCVTAQAAVIAAVSAGQILPGQGQVLSSLIDAQRAAFETHELAKRLAVIEETVAKRG